MDQLIESYYFIEQNLSSKDYSKDFMLKLFQVLDEQDSKDKSTIVNYGIREGARKDVIHANNRLYEYKYIKEANSLELIESEAEVIKLIYKLYSEGFGTRRIIDYLRDNKIKTRKGKEFTKGTISRILSNEKYVGILVRNKYDTGNLFNKYSYPDIRPKEEWIIHKGRIPAIINKELFDKCQNLRASKKSTSSQRGMYKGIADYAGIIKCSRCGNSYTSNVDKDRKFSNCSLKKKIGVKACDNPNVSLKTLDEVINTVNFKKEIRLCCCNA